MKTHTDFWRKSPFSEKHRTLAIVKKGFFSIAKRSFREWLYLKSQDKFPSCFCNPPSGRTVTQPILAAITEKPDIRPFRKARPVAPSVNPSGGKTAATGHLKRKRRPDYLTADLVPTHSTLVISPLRSKPHHQRVPAIHCARLRRGLPL